jgi:hypothetical protein
MASIYNLPVQKTGTPVRESRRLELPGEKEVKEVAARVLGEPGEDTSVRTPRAVPFNVVQMAAEGADEEVEGSTLEPGLETGLETGETGEDMHLANCSFEHTVSLLRVLLEKLYREGGVRGIGGPNGVEDRIHLDHYFQTLIEALELSPGEAKQLMESPELPGLVHSLQNLRAEYEEYKGWGKIQNWMAYYRGSVVPLFEKGAKLLDLVERFRIPGIDMFDYQLGNLLGELKYGVDGRGFYEPTEDDVIRRATSILEKFVKEPLTEAQANALADRCRGRVELLIRNVSDRIRNMESDCKDETNRLAGNIDRSDLRLKSLQQTLQRDKAFLAAHQELKKLFRPLISENIA